MRTMLLATTLSSILFVSSAQAQTVTVTLRNENFGNVLVEAQIEGSSSLGTRSLSKGQAWAISCPKGGGVLYRSHEEPNDWGEWIRASCGFDFSYRISDGGRIRSGENRDRRGCDVLASRGVTASHARLTDGVVGSNSPGQNSGKPGGTFWVELAQPEWVHHVTLHPFGNGTPGTHTLVGYGAGGASVTLGTSNRGASSVPYTIEVDASKSKNIKRVELIVTPDNNRDWVAFTEVEVFVCR